MDYQLLQDLQSKLRDDTNENAMNVEQRQRIFEDIIIQRIKVIQNFVKKQVQKLKIEINQNGGVSNPVILNSIHNDGMALDLKIKDIVKWKMEAFEQKSKLKDDKLLQLEVAQNRTDKQFKDTVTAISDASQQEFDMQKREISQLQERIQQHEENVQLLTEQMTQ